MRFSERYGFKKASDIIQIDGMDENLRTGIWNLLTDRFFPNINIDLNKNPIMAQISNTVITKYLKIPIDKVSTRWNYASNDDPRLIIRESYYYMKWYEVYDFLEFCYEHLTKFLESPTDFANSCNAILQAEGSGYRLVGGKLIKITSTEEIQSIENAQGAINSFQSVGIHINAALDLLSRRPNPDFRNSIKESISAVEAACCVITADPKATLGKALSQMEKNGFNMHAAQKDAFTKLYGYTSDADGIRHALLDEEALTYEDAQFMLVTCSAFVNYLKMKVAQ